jgi:hypothetical protein
VTTIIRDLSTKYYALKNGQCVAESYNLTKLIGEVSTLYHNILPVIIRSNDPSISDRVVSVSTYDKVEDVNHLYPKIAELL